MAVALLLARDGDALVQPFEPETLRLRNGAVDFEAGAA